MNYQKNYDKEMDLDIKQVLEFYAAAYNEHFSTTLDKVSTTLSKKLGISKEIIEEKIKKDLDSYNNDIDSLTIDEAIDKIEDYLLVDEVNKDYFA